MPWIILTVFVFVWGLPSVKAFFNGLYAPKFPIDGLHNMVEKVAPAVANPTKEAAIYVFGLLSTTGTGILLAAIVGGLFMRYNPFTLVLSYFKTIWAVRLSLLTIVLMLGLGTVISIKTVEAHRANLMEKLKVNRAAKLLQLTLRYREAKAKGLV